MKFKLLIIIYILNFSGVFLKIHGESIKNFNDYFQKISEVKLVETDGFHLSVLPRLVGINENNDFIILDNLNVRNVLVFDKNGTPRTKIGSFGRDQHQFLFPETLYYQKERKEYYIYDSDLLRILVFDNNFEFKYNFFLPLFLEQIIVTKKGRIFCYTSGVPNEKGPDRVIYECTREGKIINKFAKQSKNYCKAGESKGGGIVLKSKNLFVITPYEYEIRKYNLDGKLIKKIQGNSLFYTPPIKIKDLSILKDFKKRNQYHNSWSHIRQIISIGEDFIGIIYLEPGGPRSFLDIYDLNLNIIEKNIQMPQYVGGPAGVFSEGDFIYLLKRPKEATKNNIIPPSIEIYRCKIK